MFICTGGSMSLSLSLSYEPKILSQDWVLSGGVVWTASSVYLGRGAIKCLVNNLHHVMPLQNNLKDFPSK